MDGTNNELNNFKTTKRIEDSLGNYYAYQNELLVPPQTSFTDNLRHAYLVPVRAELSNGHLFNYLRQMKEQQKTLGEPLGVIILLNNREYDSTTIQSENAQTAQYLTLLIQKNLEAIKSLTIPDNYKSLAEELLRNSADNIELRFDYITVIEDKHMGRLRDNLLGLAEKYRSQQVNAEKMVVHFSDIDTVYRPKHTAELNRVYSGKTLANIAKTDYEPGRYEDDTEEIQFTREVIESFDSMRIWKIANRINSWINGGYQSVTPSYSGQLSFFNQRHVRKTLSTEARSDDYALGSLLRREQIGTIAHEGEVYVVDRAKYPNSDPVLHLAHTDAESRYHFTKNHSAIIPRIDTDKKISFDMLESEENISFLLTELPKIRINPEGYNWDRVVMQIAPDIYRKIQQTPDSKGPFYHRLSKLVADWPNRWSLPEEDGGHDNIYPYGSEDEMKYFIQASFLFHGFIMNKIRGSEPDYYILPDETNKYIQYTESLIEKNFLKGVTLQENSDFQEQLKEELRHEQAKVLLRKSRLIDFIQEIKRGIQEVPSTAQAEFFRKYYPEIEGQIKDAVEHQQPDNEIVQAVTAQFPDFFLPEAQIHTNIAHLKAIEQYLKKNNVCILNDERDYKYM